MIIVDNPKLFDVSAWNMPVKAFITRDCQLEEIQYALHSLRNGKKFFCEKLLDALSPDTDNARIDINKREYEVLQKITQGKQTAEIAEELFLSTHTINTYRKRLLRKFDVRTPVELVVKSIKEGFIQL
ncbi:MAG: response regulator transcription factor [Cryomorphaceae bacterium]|nr:response regulator transcription factor [Cryomorphaceae bacterium]